MGMGSEASTPGGRPTGQWWDGVEWRVALPSGPWCWGKPEGVKLSRKLGALSAKVPKELSWQ